MVVPTGIRPVHSFDLWGVILDQRIIGQYKIDRYRAFARENRVPEDEMERVVHDYLALINGEPWATGSRKNSIVEAITKPAALEGIGDHYASAFQEDALIVMQEILDAGEGVVIFTSGPAPGLLDRLPPGISERIGGLRYGNKADTGAFKELFKSEAKLGHRVVTHTADELPELIVGKESGLFERGGLIYVCLLYTSPSPRD